MTETNMIDIGANLTSHQFNNIDQILDNCTQHNIDTIIITGSSLKNSAEAIQLTKKHNYKLYTTVGIHPHKAKEYNSKTSIQQMKKLLKHPKAVAVGECGLDYYRNLSPKQKQLECFEAHIQLAIELKLPMFIHERDAFDDCIKLFDKYMDKLKDNKIVIHCYTGTEEHMLEYIARGFYIGITGYVCRKKMDISWLKKIPINKLMIETDAPYMKPWHIRGKVNYPENLRFVAKTVAGTMGIDLDDFKKRVRINTLSFFDIK